MKAETRQKLFNYMSNEHGLHLLENELDEIERILGDKREYAKAKVEERDNLLQDYADEIGNEIAVQITIEKAKTPDFK